MTTNFLLIICGISFAGKTSLAMLLRKRFGWAEVDVDETKLQLFGPRVRDEDLKPADWVRMYTETDDQILAYLRAGQTVIDASRNFSRAERKQAWRIAESAHVPLLTIYVDTPEEVARQRLLRNRQSPTRRDVNDLDFEDVLRAMDQPDEGEGALVLHYVDDPVEWIGRVLEPWISKLA